MLRAASTAALLLLAAATAASAQEAPSRWAIDTSIATLDFCNPASLDVEAAVKAAESAGWPKFKKIKLSGIPSRLSVKVETPDAKGAPRVGLAYQSVTGQGTTIFTCYVQTTRPVTEALRDELKRRYGGDGEAGWWMKDTPQGRSALTLGEMVDGVNGFRPLLDKLPENSRIIFARVAGDDDETQVTTSTFAKAD